MSIWAIGGEYGESSSFISLEPIIEFIWFWLEFDVDGFLLSWVSIPFLPTSTYAYLGKDKINSEVAVWEHISHIIIFYLLSLSIWKDPSSACVE